MIVSTLTDKLLHHETNNSKLFLTSDVGHDNSTIISDTTNSTTTTAMKGLPSISRGKADCLLIAGGKVLAAHRYSDDDSFFFENNTLS